MSSRGQSDNLYFRVSSTIFAFIFLIGNFYSPAVGDSKNMFSPGKVNLKTPAQITIAPCPGASTSAAAMTDGSWQVYFTDPKNRKLKDQDWQSSMEALLINRINASKKTIHIAAYELDSSRVADALICAAVRGVQVQWVTDDKGGLDSDLRKQFPKMENDTKKTKYPIEVRSDRASPTKTALMHDKFWIFDGEIVWTGSTNITQSAFFNQHNNSIVIKDKKLAAIYEAEFQEMWNGKFGTNSPRQAKQSITLTKEGPKIDTMFTPDSDAMTELVNAVRCATKYVHFIAFSFTDKNLAAAMIDRADGKGFKNCNKENNPKSSAKVQIEGIFDSSQQYVDGPFSQVDDLYCRKIPNISVYRYGVYRYIHSKVIIIDDQIVVTGSLNFSTSGNEKNDENVMVINNKDIALRYEADFQKIRKETPRDVSLKCPPIPTPTPKP